MILVVIFMTVNFMTKNNNNYKKRMLFVLVSVLLEFFQCSPSSRLNVKISLVWQAWSKLPVLSKSKWVTLSFWLSCNFVYKCAVCCFLVFLGLVGGAITSNRKKKLASFSSSLISWWIKSAWSAWNISVGSSNLSPSNLKSIQHCFEVFVGYTFSTKQVCCTNLHFSCSLNPNNSCAGRCASATGIGGVDDSEAKSESCWGVGGFCGDEYSGLGGFDFKIGKKNASLEYMYKN